MSAALTLAVPAANGSGASQRLPSNWGTACCSGSSANFDSATVKLEASYDGGTRWQQATDPTGDPITFAAEGLKTYVLGGEPLVRATVTGSAGACAATLTLQPGVSPTRVGATKFTLP